MTTLAEYAHQHFPNHPTNGPDGEVALSSHTVVAQVTGRERADEMSRGLRTAMGDSMPLSQVVIEPTTPTVADTGGEDPEGIVDLPHRRVAVVAVGSGVVLGVAVGLVTGFAAGSPALGLIVGVFAAILGGVIGGMLGGGGRYAGDRAWEQSHEPDATIVLVAGLFDDERSAAQAAEVMSGFEPDDVRILDEGGAWHSPNV